MNKSEIVKIDNVDVQIDTNGNFYGFAFRLTPEGRLFTQGGFTTRQKAYNRARTTVSYERERAHQRMIGRLLLRY